jgi:hypothetical protein
MGESAFLSKETKRQFREVVAVLRTMVCTKSDQGDNQAGKSQSPSRLRTAISIMLSPSQSHLVYTPAVSHLA